MKHHVDNNDKVYKIINAKKAQEGFKMKRSPAEAWFTLCTDMKLMIGKVVYQVQHHPG